MQVNPSAPIDPTTTEPSFTPSHAMMPSRNQQVGSNANSHTDVRVRSMSPDISPQSSPSLTSGSTKFTTREETRENLALLQNLMIAMNQAMHLSNPENSEPSLQEKNKAFLLEQLRKKVGDIITRVDGSKQDKPKKIEDYTNGHVGILGNYFTYLRGKLEEVGQNNIEDELIKIELLLTKRNTKLPPQSPNNSDQQNSPVQSSPPQATSFFNTSPKKEDPSAETLEMIAAWDILKSLAQIIGELQSLQREFAFVENGENSFAKEYRRNAYVTCLEKYKGIQVKEISKKNPELAAVSTRVTVCQDKIQKLLPRPSIIDYPLSDRAVFIAKEFCQHFASIEQFKQLKELQVSTAVLKQILKAERLFEHHNDPLKRRGLFELHAVQLRDLRKGYEDCNTAILIVKIQEEMRDVQGDIEDLNKMLMQAQKVTGQFEDFKKTLNSK